MRSIRRKVMGHNEQEIVIQTMENHSVIRDNS